MAKTKKINQWVALAGLGKEPPVRVRSWQASTPANEKRREQTRQWMKANRVYMNAYWAKWRKENREARRAIQHRYKLKVARRRLIATLKAVLDSR